MAKDKKGWYKSGRKKIINYRSSKETLDGKYTCSIGHRLKLLKCKGEECEYLKLDGKQYFNKK